MNNIADILTRQAQLEPDKIAINYIKDSFSYQELEELVWKCSTYLSRKGLKKDNIVIFMIEDEFLMLLSLLATARLGATSISLTKDISAQFIQDMIKNVNISLVITDMINTEFSIIQHIYLDKKLFKEIKIDKTIYIKNPKVPWRIVIGSGSTGKKKLIPIYHKKFLIRLDLLKDWDANKDDCVASLVSMAYSSTQTLFLDVIYLGATYVLINKNESIFELIKKKKITILSLSVLHVEKILNILNRNSYQVFGNLKMMRVVSSKVSMKLRNQICSRLTKNLYILYGANEIHIISNTNSNNAFSELDTVGKPIKGINIEIVDKDGDQKSINEVGLIRVKSPAMIDGYLNDKEATQKAFKDGWFYPGDIGKFTEDGQLIHLGRSDDMMIMNGMNIYPSHIENVMLEHDDIKEAIAIAYKHPIHQDVPICMVILKKNSKANEEELLRYAKNHLHSFSPQRIIIAETIPRNSQGKVIKAEILKVIDKRLNNNQSLRSYEKGKYKFLQPMIGTPLNINIKSGLDITIIDKWLKEVMQIEIEKCSSNLLMNSDKNLIYVIKIVWRILLLRKAFLNAVNVPVFDVGDIIDIKQNATNQYTVTILVTRIDNIPADLYITSIQLSMNMVLDQFQVNPSEINRIAIFDIIESNFLKKYAYSSGSGKSTMPILIEAYKKNIPFMHFGNGIYQLGWGVNSKIFSRSSIMDDSAIGANLSENKIVASDFVRNFGLPSPVHDVVKTYDQALVSAKKLGWPVVVKPVDLNRGEGVAVGIETSDNLKKAFDIAYKRSNIKKVIIEKQVDGVCCRIFIANGKMLYAVNRLPKSIIADGISTVEELIEKENKRNSLKPPWKRTEVFPKDDEAINVIKKAGYALNTVVKKDILIPLREIESTQWGGYDEDVTDTIHPENIEIAKKAARLFNLHIAGIDIISSDITKPWHQNGAIINEVNYSPAYGAGEIAKATIPKCLEMLIKNNSRISIIAYIGDEKAFKNAKAYQKKRLKKDFNTFLTSHKTTISNTLENIVYPNESLYSRVKSLLMDNTVEELVIVIQTNEFLFQGLPIDSIDEIIEVSSEIQNYNDETTLIEKVQYEQLKNILYSIN